jgi:hypothetical protein
MAQENREHEGDAKNDKLQHTENQKHLALDIFHLVAGQSEVLARLENAQEILEYVINDDRVDHAQGEYPGTDEKRKLELELLIDEKFCAFVEHREMLEAFSFRVKG